VGFVMGAAFKAVIDALVANIIMPIVAIPFGQPNFDAIIWTVNGSEILVGSFVTAFVSFFLVAVGVFLFIVKPYNAYRSRLEAAGEVEDAAPAPSEVDLLMEIRDSLRGGTTA
ncbi:MAG: MscL family protein, partial [Acidimicrobiia bacterium]